MINRQKGSRNCGPIAIYNTLRLIGHDISYSDVEEFCLENKWYEPGFGMTDQEILDAFMTIGLVVNPISESISLKLIDQYLDQGHFIVFRYCNLLYGHIVVISARTNKTYTIWNFGKTNKSPRIHRKTLAKMIRYTTRWHPEYTFMLPV